MGDPNVLKQLRASLHSYSLLYVEDNEGLNAQATILFKKFFDNVISAYDGEEGLRLFQQHRPQIIITDINMPKMDGLKMSEAIHEIDSDSIIIITTAHDELEFLHRSIKIGIFDYLTKPLKIDTLVDTFTRCVSILTESLHREVSESTSQKKEFINDVTEDGLLKFYNNKAIERERIIKDDKTFRALIEMEVLNTQDRINSQSRYEAMGEIISMIAHQWRQPLSTISMTINNFLIDLDLDGFDPDQCKKNGNEILSLIRYLSETINMFCNVLHLDKEKDSSRIIDIIREAEAMIGASLHNNGIVLEIVNESEIIVEMYSRELLQVIINIVNNAKEALVSNQVQNKTINIHIYDENGYAVTRLCNNGGTIPIEVMPHIFDPYFSTKDEKTGTGLGLYMSKTIIEKHLRGKIDVENSENGVCFTIRLPAKED
jgi:signal transduction histidine kinase